MSKLKSKRAVFAAVVVLSGVVGAVAYWTAGGSGTGSGATAAETSSLKVNQTTALDPMFPGDSPQTISGDFDNPNSGPVYVRTLTASIESVTKAAGAPAGTCDETDFRLANAAMTVNASVPSGNGRGAWTGATIQFNDKAGTNQDACKGATVKLSYTIS